MKTRVHQLSNYVPLACGACIAVTSFVTAQVLPCVLEYTGNSCTMFEDHGVCPSVTEFSSPCPQTKRASAGLSNQDPSFSGPWCHILYKKQNESGVCVDDHEYDGKGRCRTASGTTCPSGPPQ